MKKAGGWQLAVGRRRCAIVVVACRSLPAIASRLLVALFILLPASNCLLPTAFAAGAWVRQRSNSLAWLHALYFLDENRGWAVGGNGVLLATTDGGENWRAASRPTEDSLRDIFFSDEQNGWLVCERSIYKLKTHDEPITFLLRTTDGGATWTRVKVMGAEPDVRLMRALFTEGGRGWVFGEAGALFATRDGGTSWEKQSVPTRYLLLGGSFLDDARGWVVGAGATLLQTADGGENWRAANIKVPEHLTRKEKEAAGGARRVRFTSVSFVDEKHGWAVGAAGIIFATRDGGRTWVEQSSNVTADLSDVKFLDKYEGWAVGTGGTLIHTIDGGARWTIEPSGTPHALERLFFVGRTRGWAVGFGGTIITYDRNAKQRAPGLKNK